jgi:assimilatory nitrate reductase catalytic subunit
VHPDLGFADGDPVRVVSRRGATTLPALVTTTIRADTVFIPYHWAGAVAANALTVDALDERSRIPEFKVCACRVERGDGLDPVPPPPMPLGIDQPRAEVAALTDPASPSSSQGRSTADRHPTAER